MRGLDIDYFASTSLSKLEEMISTEKNATIRQKSLLYCIGRQGKPKGDK